MKIVIILPTYNERINIEKMIPLLEEQVLPKITKNTIEILVVDDNSPDGTAEVVENFMKKWKNLHLLLGQKQGLGAAYVRGMHYAMDELKADAVMEFDADFQHDPHDIPQLIHAMDEGADYVIGSRYIKGGAIPQEWGLDRKFLSVFGSLFTRIVWLNFRIHDMTSGFKLTKTSYLQRVDLDHLLSKNFAYKMHILHDVVALGAKVTEVPIVFYEREKGASKISQKDQFESLYVVLRLGIVDQLRFIKFLFVGGTGFIVQIVTQELSYSLGLAAFLAVFLHPVVNMFTHASDGVALANGVAAAIGAESAIISNFTLNNIWTFKDRAHKGFLQTIQRGISFNLASFGSVIIQFLAIWIGVSVFGPSIRIFSHHFPTRDIILVPTIIVLVIPLNYLIYNKIIWRKKPVK